MFSNLQFLLHFLLILAFLFHGEMFFFIQLQPFYLFHSLSLSLQFFAILNLLTYLYYFWNFQLSLIHCCCCFHYCCCFRCLNFCYCSFSFYYLLFLVEVCFYQSHFLHLFQQPLQLLFLVLTFIIQHFILPIILFSFSILLLIFSSFLTQLTHLLF